MSMMRYIAAGMCMIIVLMMTGIESRAATSIVGTKHDLSYRVSGSVLYQAASGDPTQGGTTQICIFCHTPHGGNTDAPLWNRATSQSSYNIYQSDVLSALGITAENPSTGAVHVKSRICLSCHDGTVALGSVANMPYDIPADLGYGGGFSAIKMATGYATMLPASAGYIGADGVGGGLQDDHPIAIKHVSGSAFGQDPELKLPTSSNVRLYNVVGGKAVVKNPPANGDYVECTSCHNAHDNTSGYFLVEPNTGSALCRDCHQKYGIDQGGPPFGIHSQSTVLYQPPSGSTPPVPIGTTVGGVQCMTCHYMHKSGVLDTAKTTPNPSAGKYLLSYQEEQTCFNTNGDRWNSSNGNTVCHGSLASNPNIRIKPVVELGNGNAHRVGNYQNLHNASEGSLKGWYTPSNWHVECQDCHNVHTAGNAVHTEGSNTIVSNSSLYGAAGVRVDIAPIWTDQRNGSYTYFEPYGLIRDNLWPVTTHYEYEICFKCHSDWAWGNGTIPNYSKGGNWTNQAMEFGGSISFHPVMRQLTGRISGSLTAEWGGISTNTMYCSDCHTKQNSDPRPVGPHGSINSPILRNSYDTTYGTRGIVSNQLPTDFCMDCHDASQYQAATLNNIVAATVTGFRDSNGSGINLHTQHAYRAQFGGGPLPVISRWPYRCVDCHTRVPHGYNRKAMIVVQNEGFPYEATAGQGKITLPEPSLSLPYTISSCSTVAGCHTN